MTDPQVIVNLGTGGSDLNGQNGSTSSADSNDARFLDWPGDNAGNYVYLPGVAGNYLSVPDEAALDITGDIDIRVQVALDDWTPSVSILAAKRSSSSASNLSWVFYISGGNLILVWNDGSSNFLKQANASTGVTDGSPKWVRATLDVDNGSTENEVKFFVSDDNASWVQIGTTIVTSGVTSIQATTSPVEVGTQYAGTNSPTAGKLYRAQVLDGIDGTTVLDIDTSVITSGSATSFTAATGQTVTINRSTSGRKSVAVVSPVWLFGTDDEMIVSSNALLNFDATEDFTLLVVLRQWDTPINGARIIYKRETSSPNVGYDIRNVGTQIRPQIIVDDGPTAVTRNGGTNASGSLSVFGFRVDRSAQELRVITDSLEGSGSDISSVGSLVNSTDMEIGGLLSVYQDFELIGVSLFRRALTATEIQSVVAYYQNRLS